VGLRVIARQMIGAFAAAAMLVSLVGVSPVAALTPSTTTLWPMDLNPKPQGLTTDLTAEVPSGATGTVDFVDDQGGTRTTIGSAPVALDDNVAGLYRARYTVPADYPNGTYNLIAVYSGDGTYEGSESSPMAFTVGPRPSSVALQVSGPHDSSGATAQRYDTITVQAQALDGGGYTPNQPTFTGSIAIQVDGVTKATIGINDSVALSTGSWATGAHVVTGAFTSTNDNYENGVSPDFPITIRTNVVEATANVQYTTFYPMKDAYRDTVALRGSRNEKASVSIRVYNSAGTRVKLASIASATGKWSYAWSGRNSAGTVLAAGKYKVLQVVTDSHGTKRTFTSYVNLSRKRLYTYTVTLTKNFEHLTKNTATWGAWSFTLPSATVYKGLTFSIYGRDTAGSGGFGPNDYTVCGSSIWNVGCVTRYRTFPKTFSWKSFAASPSKDRSGRAVRLYAWGGYGDTRIVYGRVKVTYAVLK
jgi:hypothetical protein